MGFEQFVNTLLWRTTLLYHWSCLSDSVNIVEQSGEKVVFVASPIYPQLENQGAL